MLRRMGPLQSVMKMIPGLGNQLKDVQIDERELKRVEAIILSMTPHERRLPHVIDLSRRRRIASGSGTSLDQVNRLISARKQMAKMMKGLGKGKMPALPGMPVPAAIPGGAGGDGGPARRQRARSGRNRKKRRK
jgi:signal recognition particle subunit SRP54